MAARRQASFARRKIRALDNGTQERVSRFRYPSFRSLRLPPLTRRPIYLARSTGVGRVNWTIIQESSSAFPLVFIGRHISRIRMHPDPVAAGPDVLEDILFRLLSCFMAPFLGKLPLERLEERFRHLRCPKAFPAWMPAASCHGGPSNAGRPWMRIGRPGRHGRRLPSSGGSPRPAACSMASTAAFPAIRSGIGRPTALREEASIAAARQSRPSRAGMQVMPPARSLFPSPTEKTRSTRFGRGSPGSTFSAILCLPAAPSAAIPGFRMICGTRFPLATMPPRRNSRSMRRQPQRPLCLRDESTASPSSASRSIRASGFFRPGCS